MPWCHLGPAAAGDDAGGGPLSSRAQDKGMEESGTREVLGLRCWKWGKPEFLLQVTEGLLVVSFKHA